MRAGIRRNPAFAMTAAAILSCAASEPGPPLPPRAAAAPTEELVTTAPDAPGAAEDAAAESVAAAPPSAPAPQGLSQGWNHAQREEFWWTSQGSHLLPLSWFLALEQSESQELFRSDSHMDALRYIPAPSTQENLHAFPVGFAVDKRSGEEWIGVTCAACHTGLIEFNGTRLLVEGGAGLGDFSGLLSTLSRALRETVSQEAKFQRFADRVLGPDADGRAGLRTRLGREAERLERREQVNSLPQPQYPPDYPGFGRVDAYGIIYNQIAALALDEPANRVLLNAPASVPVLWGAPYADRVQWNGAAENRPLLGALLRNLTQAIGAFAQVEIEPVPFWKFWKRQGYASSIDVKNLGRLEQLLWELRAPKWPTRLFGELDPLLLEAGETLYKANCSGCHVLVPEGERYQAPVVPLVTIQTDPMHALNAATRQARAGRLEGVRKYIALGRKFREEELTQDLILNAVVGLLLRDTGAALDAMVIGSTHPSASDVAAGSPSRAVELEELLEAALTRASGQTVSVGLMPLGYRARPHHGIWATAPYLHNGSVPSLAEMLKPPNQRVAKFHVGSREFDPEAVGFTSTPGPGTRELDTSLPGNSNVGHPFGTQLSEGEKKALIEFLKSL